MVKEVGGSGKVLREVRVVGGSGKVMREVKEVRKEGDGCLCCRGVCVEKRKREKGGRK